MSEEIVDNEGLIKQNKASLVFSFLSTHVYTGNPVCTLIDILLQWLYDYNLPFSEERNLPLCLNLNESIEIIAGRKQNTAWSYTRHSCSIAMGMSVGETINWKPW